MEELWKEIKAEKTPGTIPVVEEFWGNFEYGDCVLEVGCGWGRIIFQCLKRELEVVGIDVNKKSVEYLNEKIKNSSVSPNRVKILNKSVLDTNFEDSSFDGVLMQGLLSALKKDDRMKAIREISRILKSGGVIHVGEFKFHEKFKERYEKDYPKTGEYGTLSVTDDEGKEIFQSHNFEISELIELLKEGGFENIEVIEKEIKTYHNNKKPGIMVIAENQ